MDRFPRRARAGRTRVQLLEKFGNQADAREVAAPKGRIVPCARHEDHGEWEFTPCLISDSLQDAFTENAILRLISKLQPQLCFFVRAYPENFSSSVRGISILRPLAEKAKINDKEVELVEVKDNDDDEVKLASATMVLHSRYLSKRDIWSMHLTMMQDRGQLLYANFNFNMRQHIPNSRIEKLTAGPDRKPVACGLVTRSTEVTFKSSTANMCVLIQVSAEMFTFGLAGRPYYEILLECFCQLLEKSLRVYGSDGSGHYLRMILFARVSSRVSDRERSNSKRPGQKFDEDEVPPVDRNSSSKSLNPLPKHEDYYDIFWEGFARAMPPAQQLIARVRQVFMHLHNQKGNEHNRRNKPFWKYDEQSREERCRCDWRGIAANDIVEASRGNLLECLNVVLDSYDNHHLDRRLKVVGQPVVVLTAGNGILHASSADLYELTHRRFITAGPSSCHLLCVREPPLHSTPFIDWPEKRFDLPRSPQWLQVFYYPEVCLCTCPPETERISSSLLPLEDISKSAFVPQWSFDAQNLKESSRAVKLASCDASNAILFQRNSANTIEAIPWEIFRVCRLRVAAAVTEVNIATPLEDKFSYQDNYQQTSARFPEKSVTEEMNNAELKNLMNDLVGLRLEVVTSTEIAMKEGRDSNHWIPIHGFRRKEKNGVHNAAHDRSWKPEGSLMAVQATIVRAANGMQWLLDPQQDGSSLDISQKCTEQRDVKVKWFYNGFFVRRLLVSDDQDWIDIPDSANYAQQIRDNLGRDMRGNDIVKTAMDEELTIDQFAEFKGMDLQKRFPIKIKQDWSQVPRDSDTKWVPSRRIFHLPPFLAWNKLDAIIAGSMVMPPAIPYPVDRSGSDSKIRSDDKCWGWELRSSVKQHFYALIPREESERSHTEHLVHTLKRLGGRIDIGVDPFRDDDGCSVGIDRYDDIRQGMMERFKALKVELNDLCSGKARSQKQRSELQLNISVDLEDDSCVFNSEGTTVYVKNLNIDSSFPESRDWFELFYDNKYAPPKYFHIVMQWIVCSSVHMVNFLARFNKLVDKHGFQLVQLPIAQLFPQPSPDFLWTDDHETNFGRISLQPRRKIALPRSTSDRDKHARSLLYARLLEAWLLPPLSLAFLFFTPVRDSLANAQPTMEGKQRATQGIYQRSRGWVLSDKDALCLVALREDNIYWYENEIPLAEARDFHSMEKRLHEISEMRHAFYDKTYKVFDELLREAKHESKKDTRADSPDYSNCSGESCAKGPSALDGVVDDAETDKSELCSPVSLPSVAPLMEEVEELDLDDV